MHHKNTPFLFTGRNDQFINCKLLYVSVIQKHVLRSKSSGPRQLIFCYIKKGLQNRGH
jgi:hypothetical protein